ncbi:MAG: IS21-like element helper ATPase IstB [Bacteroidia bacterium]|nr:ATP-binding protein [Bacteroidota bacterium]MBP9083834.1 IS21-like element helper ATPase IstB [Bacteroidia bacterium]
MNTDTLDKMKQMHLLGMHRAFSTSLQTERNEQLTADEMTAMLVDSEWDDRHNRSIERTTKNARFRYKATIEQLDYRSQRGLDKNHIQRLADGKYITQNENILITGPTGTGKSFLASALGHQACGQRFKVLYANATRLFAQLKMAKADGSAIREFAKIEKQDLFILDDFGIQPFDQASRTSLLEILEDRHGKRSIIITSQLPVKQWYEVIGEKTVADAILDRILHHAQRIELKGESLRKNQHKKSEDNNE